MGKARDALFSIGKRIVEQTSPQGAAALEGIGRDYTEGLTYESVVDHFARTHGGAWSRTTEDNGATVVLYLELPNGDRVTARGRTTADAFTDLQKRVTARGRTTADAFTDLQKRVTL